MATTYAGMYTAVNPAITTPTFSQRMEMAIVKNAGFIFGEIFTAKTPARAALAFKVCQPGVAANFAPAFVAQAAAQGFACDATTTDAQIDGVISSEWNLMADAE